MNAPGVLQVMVKQWVGVGGGGGKISSYAIYLFPVVAQSQAIST